MPVVPIVMPTPQIVDGILRLKLRWIAMKQDIFVVTTNMELTVDVAMTRDY